MISAQDSQAQADLTAQLLDLALLIQAVHERCAREHDVSPILARLLEAVSDRAPTITELAALLGLDKSSTSGLVDRAQRRGLVRRLPSQLDRRSVRVRLTPAGRALGLSISSRLGAGVAAIFEPLPDADRAALADALRAIPKPR